MTIQKRDWHYTEAACDPWDTASVATMESWLHSANENGLHRCNPQAQLVEVNVSCSVARVESPQSPLRLYRFRPEADISGMSKCTRLECGDPCSRLRAWGAT